MAEHTIDLPDPVSTLLADHIVPDGVTVDEWLRLQATETAFETHVKQESQAIGRRAKRSNDRPTTTGSPTDAPDFDEFQAATDAAVDDADD
jgi:hypothetical protein